MPLVMSAGFDVLRLVVRANPVVRGFPCGKRVRWLRWSPLTDFAQPHNFKFANRDQAKNSEFSCPPSWCTCHEAISRAAAVAFRQEGTQAPVRSFRKARATRRTHLRQRY